MTCSGADDCAAEVHTHGCFADFGRCDSPAEHHPSLKDAVNRALDEPMHEYDADGRVITGFDRFVGELESHADVVIEVGPKRALSLPEALGVRAWFDRRRRNQS